MALSWKNKNIKKNPYYQWVFYCLFIKNIKKARFQSVHFETSVIIKRIRVIFLVLFLLAILFRERYLTREEIKTQYQKAEKPKRRSHKHKYRFSVLTNKKKNSFQRLLSSTPWNKLAIIYNSKKRKCVTFTNTFAFCLLEFSLQTCACLSERSENTCI